jgi:hypothetical protein
MLQQVVLYTQLLLGSEGLSGKDGWMDGWMDGYGASQILMRLGLTLIDPLFPKSISREPRGLAKVPNGPQTYTLNIHRLQKKGAQMHVSERGQSLTFTMVSSSTPHCQHNGLPVSPCM